VTFLAPLAGLLAGGLGLAALLALHALKLRRRPVRISSTLLWRNATRDLEVNTPWQRPRATWMLLLQILAIALLALGIARPVLGSGGSITGRVVVVIDASASMNATDERGVSRFDRAVDAARERLNGLRRSDASPEIAIVRAAHTPAMVLAPTRSLGDALGALDAVTPTDQSLDADALRDLLGSLRETGEDDETNDTLTVWAFTDGGSLRAEELPGVAGEIVAIGSESPNAGIAAATGSRDPEDPSRARIFVRLVSNADRPVGVVVRVSSPDETIRTPVEIPAATEDAPGAITRTIAVDAPGAARVEITLEREDALAADNAAWVDLPDPPPPPPRGFPPPGVYAPEGRADPFLLDPLEVLAPGAVSVHPPTDLEATRGAGLVVYDRITPQRLPGVPTLGFGSAWPESDLGERSGRERVVAWDRVHPALRDVSLSSVVYDRAVNLPGGDTPGVTVLAESAAGPVITETVGAGVRHIRVAFPLERSNWGVEVGMAIFVAQAFERLAPGTRGEGVVRTTTDPVRVRASDDRVTATGPAEAVAIRGPDGTAALPPLERVGVYTLDNATPSTVAISMLDESESMLAVADSASLGTPGRTTASADTGRRELWPYALLIAVVLMTLEYLIHAARARV
jgi:hypothetical protein